MTEDIKKRKKKVKPNKAPVDIDTPGPDKTISIKLKDQPEKFFAKPYQAWDYFIRMRPPKQKKKLNKDDKSNLKRQFKDKQTVSYRKEDGEVNPDE